MFALSVYICVVQDYNQDQIHTGGVISISILHHHYRPCLLVSRSTLTYAPGVWMAATGDAHICPNLTYSVWSAYFQYKQYTSWASHCLWHLFGLIRPELLAFNGL